MIVTIVTYHYVKNLYKNCETKPLLTFEKGRNEGERKECIYPVTYRRRVTIE